MKLQAIAKPAATRSALHQGFFQVLLDAPPRSVDRMGRALLTAEQPAHLFAETVGVGG